MNTVSARRTSAWASSRLFQGTTTTGSRTAWAVPSVQRSGPALRLVCRQSRYSMLTRTLFVTMRAGRVFLANCSIQPSNQQPLSSPTENNSWRLGCRTCQLGARPPGQSRLLVTHTQLGKTGKAHVYGCYRPRHTTTRSIPPSIWASRSLVGSMVKTSGMPSARR